MAGPETFLGLAGALGFTGGGAAVASAVIGVVFNIAVSTVLGKILAPNLDKNARNAKGVQANTKSAIAPRKVIYGEAVVGGPFLFMQSVGRADVDGQEIPNSTLHAIVAIAGHPIEDIIGVFFGEEYVNISGTENVGANDLDANFYVKNGPYSEVAAPSTLSASPMPLIRIIKFNGWGYADKSYVDDETGGAHAADVTADQTRAALINDINTIGPLWRVNSLIDSRDTETGIWYDASDPNRDFAKSTNCAYIFVQFNYSPEGLTSVPSMRFHVKGKRLYNPYLDSSSIMQTYGSSPSGNHDLNNPDTWEWSEDWSLCCLDYLINQEYGIGAVTDPTSPVCEIDWSEAIQSYLDSSTLVTNGLPSPDTDTAPRYTINGAFEVDATPINTMESLLNSGSGELLYAQGKYKLRPGIYREPGSPNDIINEDMIVSSLRITTHTPRDQLFNKATGIFLDKGYEGTPTTTNPAVFVSTSFPTVNPVDSSGLNPYEIEDGAELSQEFDFPYTIYSHEAQRLARIQLERVRRGFTIEFEGTMELLKYSVGDTVYLEILSNSKYINESFYNKLGLDDAVQIRPDSPQTAYYKQFKIVQMDYTENYTINIVMIEEDSNIYEWNDGYALPQVEALASEVITDNIQTDAIIPPFWTVDSPYDTITEITVATDIRTELRWSAPDRGSSTTGIDSAYVSSYEIQYGVITNPTESVAANRVGNWLNAGIVLHEEYRTTQGPVILNNLYVSDTSDYDFRVRSILINGRRSEWVYYSVETASDHTPGLPYGAKRYFISAPDGFTIKEGVGTLNLQAREITSSGVIDVGSPSTIKLYSAESPYTDWGYGAAFDGSDINENLSIVLSDGTPPGGTILDSITLTDIYDGLPGDPGADPVTINYSNPAHTVPVDNLGNETWTSSGGLLRVLEGNTFLTLATNAQINGHSGLANGEFQVDITKVSGNTLGEPVIPSSDTGTTFCSLGEWSGDLTGITVYRLNVYIQDSSGTQHTRIIDISLSPSLDGDDGVGTPGLRTVQGYLFYESTVPTTPSTPTGNTYTFATGEVSGTDIEDTSDLIDTWTNSVNTQDPTSGNTYWTIRYYGEEASPGDQSTVAVSYSNVVKHTEFSGVVRFTNGTLAIGDESTDYDPAAYINDSTSVTTIDGGNITANTLTVNEVNSTFFNGRVYTGGRFQTREPSTTSPYAGTPRTVIQQDAPHIAIYSNDGASEDIEIFGVTSAAGGGVQVSIEGDLTASIDSNIFSATGLTTLRDLLGIVITGTPTGGYATRATVPFTLSGDTPQDWPLDQSVYNTGLNENTITFQIKDSGFYEESTNQGWTDPVWDINIYYSTTGAFAGEEVEIGDYTVTGDAINRLDAEIQPAFWWGTLNLNETRVLNWTPSSPTFSADDPIYFMIRTDWVSGTRQNPRITILNATEDVVGESVSILSDLVDVDTAGVSTGSLLYKTAGNWEDTGTGVTWDGTTLNATQFGGIAQANLLDKSATETVTGAWTFTNASNDFNLGADTALKFTDGAGTSTFLQALAGRFEIGIAGTGFGTDYFNLSPTSFDHVRTPPLFILGQSAASSNIDSYGQIWVDSDDDNLYYTDDLGTTTQLNTSNTGTVTSVSAGTLIDITGTPSIDPTVNVDLSESALATPLPGTDFLLFLDGGTSGTAAKCSFSSFVGSICGNGLSQTSGIMYLNFDELTTSAGNLVNTDYLIAENGGTEARQLISSIPLSIFNNDSGWTSNTGTVTGTGSNDRVAVWTGTSGLDSSANLTFNGSTLGVTGNITVTGTVDGKDVSTLTSNAGTVTQVANGNGMNFTTFTGSGTITLGTPSTLTASTTNAVTASSHTHAITTTGTGNIVASASPTLSGTVVIPTINNSTGVILQYNGTESLATQLRTTDGNTSGAYVRDHLGNNRDIGFNDMKQISLSSSATITLNDEHAGNLIYRTGTGTDNVDMQSSTTQYPIGSTTVIMNQGTGGTLNIRDQAEVLNWVDGTGGAATTGDRVLARNGICTIWRQGNSNYYIWGTGIS